MSDLENMEVMLGNCPRNDIENHSALRKVEVDSVFSRSQESLKTIGEKIVK